MAHEFGQLMDIDHYGQVAPHPSNANPLMWTSLTPGCAFQDTGKWLSKAEWAKVNDHVANHWPDQ